jgi:3-methyladenine DNA glycosylase AlkD
MENLNKFLLDNNISLKAKGMYWLIWGIQNETDEKVSLATISSHTKDSQTAIRKAIQELLDSGHLERYSTRTKNLITGYEYKLK